jgi:hypothetical protein
MFRWRRGFDRVEGWNFRDCIYGVVKDGV